MRLGFLVALLLNDVTLSTTLEFFHLTDVHIEPFYDASRLDSTQTCRKANCTVENAQCEKFKVLSGSFDRLGRPGCDPPLGLLTSMLASMKAQNANPQFILLSGDYNGHNLPQSTITMVQDQVFTSIRAFFPTTRILPGIGNNDQDPKNTNSLAEFKRLSALFSTKANLTDDQKGTFESGGYWHWKDTTSGLRVILLNSNLMYAKLSQQQQDSWRNMSQQQFAWLEERLQHTRADGGRVIIGSHIPPSHTEGADDWVSGPMAQYQSLIERYSDTILLQVYGHHSTELIRGYSPNFGMSVASGAAPRTATVPTYQRIQHNYTANGQQSAVAKEINSYYLDLVNAATNPPPPNFQWPLLYAMSKTYGVADVSPSSLYAIATKIATDQASGNKYAALQMRGATAVLNLAPNDRTRMLCEAAASSLRSVNACVTRLNSATQNTPQEPSSDVGFIVGTVLVTVAILAIAGGVFFLVIRKRAELDRHAQELLIGD